LQLLDIKMNGFDLIQIIIFLKLKLYSRAGILITTRCSAGCRFCIYGNLEKKDAEKIVLEKGLELFEKLKIKHIGISGGEPFEAYDNLLFTTKKILSLSPPKVVSIITSANWAKSSEIVREKLDPLYDIGLINLGISIDAFHLEKIDPTNYFFIMEYLNNRGINPIVAVRYSKEIENYEDLFQKIKTKYSAEIYTKDLYIEGKATLLKDKDIAGTVKDLKRFQKRFDSFNPVKFYGSFNWLIPRCLQMTIFPNGDLHFCCCKKELTKICNVLSDDFFVSLEKFNKNWKNILYRGLFKPTTCNCFKSNLC